LRLLHPIVPFVTEALWQRLPGHVGGTYIAVAAWPDVRPLPGDPAEFERVIEGVVAIRQLRGEYGVTPGKVLAGVVIPSAS
ncbi:MAG: class I tRNA ligase family protein, partial [Gemmatimonadota bacterium]